jgi:hypothetical protein
VRRCTCNIVAQRKNCEEARMCGNVRASVRTCCVRVIVCRALVGTTGEQFFGGSQVNASRPHRQQPSVCEPRGSLRRPLLASLHQTVPCFPLLHLQALRRQLQGRSSCTRGLCVTDVHAGGAVVCVTLTSEKSTMGIITHTHTHTHTHSLTHSHSHSHSHSHTHTHTHTHAPV